MGDTRGTVRLVEGAPFDIATRGVTATLRRSDIERAARSGDDPAQLLLDVTRRQGADVEAHTLAVEWSQADLDRLLRDAEAAEEVTIAFDGDEVVAAIDDQVDVEAHGLREKVVVLTVVAVSALSTAGVAQAMPYAGSGGASDVTPAVSPATTIGGAGPAPTEQVGVTPTAGAATGAAESAVQAQVRVRGEAAERTTQIGGGASLPSGEDAALFGAAGLAIAAAGFAGAAGSRRRRPIRPA